MRPVVLSSLLLILPAAVQAQTTRPIEVVVVQGSGQSSGEQEPEATEELTPWLPQLAKLDLLRFELLGRSEKSPAAGVAVQHELPAEHRLEASWAEGEAGKLRLTLKVTRPDPGAAPGKPERELVVETEVELDPGQPCLLRCVNALPRGDLILLVSAGKKEPRPR